VGKKFSVIVGYKTIDPMYRVLNLSVFKVEKLLVEELER
jgi:hypothetical protein